MSEFHTITQYLLFGLGVLLGFAAFCFIFVRWFAGLYGQEWHEGDSAPRHRWGVILLIASAVCLGIFIVRL